ALIEGGVATAGMQAKLEAALTALQAGVPQIIIAPGAQVGIVSDLINGAAIGTSIVTQ
ncbi:MAG: hypothetical protein JO051_17785, partial [Acidobacteriaceae bacterium]|nr:hypothetical protein [Acidobacteriaceae bacterium]